MSESNVTFAALGMDLEQSVAQLKKGKLTYALNAMLEGTDGQYVNYQNEGGNEECVTFPTSYKVVGLYTIYELNKIIYFLYNPSTGDSEIGTSAIDGCVYSTIINAKCLNFNINYPILSAAHRITNCSVQIFWVDGYNRDRFIDLNELPYKEVAGDNTCGTVTTTEIDCNKLSLNPLFSIPQLSVEEVGGDGTLRTGTYQFAVQYANSNGEGYTSYYSVTNPVPIFDVNQITLNFNSEVNRSIKLSISHIDRSGFYDYYNLAVVKTVNNIPTTELVGTFFITGTEDTFIYTGQVKSVLSTEDLFLKYPIYETSKDLTTAGDVLIRDQLTTAERISYQKIFNNLTVQWQTYKLTSDRTYEDPKLSADLKGYMRDEVYALEGVFLLDDGRQTDRFHIPGRVAIPTDLEPIFNADTVDASLNQCDDQQSLPRWKVYNTASFLGQVDTPNTCYVGPYQHGVMAYWESTEEYPCNPDIWGDLAGQKIRHHKFPDSTITHIHDGVGNIFPIGIKINLDQLRQLIANSDLTDAQKAKIVSVKVVRANRANNKSVIAKGLIHNVGKYVRDGATYYYPNYPYNDRSPDPFISQASTSLTVDDFPDADAGESSCATYQLFSCCEDVVFQYFDCQTVAQTIIIAANTSQNVCAMGAPYLLQGGGQTTVTKTTESSCTQPIPNPDLEVTSNFQGFASAESRRRYVFHSPDTHFYQPFLGNVLKLETAEYGQSKGHFVQTKDHAKYKLFTSGLYLSSAAAAIAITAISFTVGLSNQAFNGSVFMATYQTITDILERITPRINYAYHYTSIGHYNNFYAIPNTGNKQRLLDIAVYMNPGMAAVGDIHPVNNFQRESSVYLKTSNDLPYTDEVNAVIPRDESRWLPDCDNPKDMKFKNISSYYASIKSAAVAQYGQIYSYESVDTGYQFRLDDSRAEVDVFGGDIFINRFGYKSKLPFFIDNRVKSPDGSDVFYNELGNVGVPTYWFSLDSTAGGTASLFALFGIPVTNLHCQKGPFTYKRGRIYLFSYGIPYYYSESEVNVENRQAFNDKEGDFYPHVSSDIPDQWLQEANVSINYDNTYYYNKTFSKQNKENYFSFLPPDFTTEQCKTVLPFRAVFSEPRTNDALETQRNNWLIYKPSSYFDFPQNYGRLTSLDGLENRQVLARFENRSQIYNALLTAPTSQAAVYLGQTLFSQQVPPIDLSNTDMGYVGSRHKFILKTEYGVVSVDDVRGHVFLITGSQARNLTLTDSGVEQFFNKNLEIVLAKYFPSVNVDNPYNGVGIHGVYDAKYNRLIITKIDYEPITSGISLINNQFYYGNTPIELGDTRYFCNKSFTISYDFDNQSWISFHSYIPSFYVGSSNFFLSGQDGQSWKHLESGTFCSFYGEVQPYVIEYPYAFQVQDEILQSISDYSKVLQYVDGNQIDVDDVYFNKAILYNNQQSSGYLELEQKPQNNMSEYMKFPKYNVGSKTILYTKSDNLYKINQFWSLVKDLKQPIFTQSCVNLSLGKVLNQSNMDYSKRTFKKAPLRAKDLKCRFILDNRTDTRIVSQILIAETQKSYK